MHALGTPIIGPQEYHPSGVVAFLQRRLILLDEDDQPALLAGQSHQRETGEKENMRRSFQHVQIGNVRLGVEVEGAGTNKAVEMWNPGAEGPRPFRVDLGPSAPDSGSEPRHRAWALGRGCHGEFSSS